MNNTDEQYRDEQNYNTNKQEWKICLKESIILLLKQKNG